MLRRSIWIPLIAIVVTLNGCTGAPTAGGVAPEPRPTSAPELENGTVVDGIRLGDPIDCVGPDCNTRLELATAEAISRHGLAPSAIGAAHFFLPYIPPGATLGGGGDIIVVLDLDDGSLAGIYTSCFRTCFVVDAQPVAPLTLGGANDHGPLVDPLVAAPVDCSTPDYPTCNDALQVAIATTTKNGFITPGTIADTHYYISYIPPGSPEAAALKAEYLVNFYIAGEHGTLAESAIGVDCGSGQCQSVTPPK